MASNKIDENTEFLLEFLECRANFLWLLFAVYGKGFFDKVSEEEISSLRRLQENRFWSRRPHFFESREESEQKRESWKADKIGEMAEPSEIFSMYPWFRLGSESNREKARRMVALADLIVGEEAVDHLILERGVRPGLMSKLSVQRYNKNLDFHYDDVAYMLGIENDERDLLKVVGE